MELVALQERKVQLQSSLQNIQQSYHIVTGHLAEVDYQLQELMKEDASCSDSVAIEEELAV